MVVDLNFLKMDWDLKHLKKIKSSWLKHFLRPSTDKKVPVYDSALTNKKT